MEKIIAAMILLFAQGFATAQATAGSEKPYTAAPPAPPLQAEKAELSKQAKKYIKAKAGYADTLKELEKKNPELHAQMLEGLQAYIDAHGKPPTTDERMEMIHMMFDALPEATKKKLMKNHPVMKKHYTKWLKKQQGEATSAAEESVQDDDDDDAPAKRRQLRKHPHWQPRLQPMKRIGAK